MNFVAPALADLGTGPALFDRLAGMEGETYRLVKSRRTFRFEHGGSAYFAKVHFGVGWGEIFKNLVSLRLPILGAGDELRAIRRLESLGVPTMEAVAFVQLGANPAARRSAIVTRELEDTISLEDLFLQHDVTPLQRRRLVEAVASMTCRMHGGGLNHRDLYICHFHLHRDSLDERRPHLSVIDLHRAQIRGRTPRRWLVKDVAGLFFSTFDAGLSERDYLRFVRRYSGKPLGRALIEDAGFWRDVARRACRLYRSEFGEVPTHIREMLA